MPVVLSCFVQSQPPPSPPTVIKLGDSSVNGSFLKPYKNAAFPTLSEDRDELDWITVVVGKEELVDAGPGKQLMAWPIDTEGNYANKSHSIFWVTKEAPYVIKLVTTIPTGKWVTVTISMI